MGYLTRTTVPNMPGYAAMTLAIQVVAEAMVELDLEELDVNLDAPHEFKVSAT